MLALNRRSLRPLRIGQSVRVQSDEERFEQAVDRFAKVEIGGALLGLPIAALAAMGTSTAVMLGYLILATIVLALVAARRPFHRPRRT